MDWKDVIGQWVWHKPTGLVDKAVRYYETGYVGIDGRQISEPVIEFASKNALLFRNHADFIVLDSDGVQVRWIGGVGAAVGELVRTFAIEAAKSGIDQEFALAVVISMLTAQLNNLR